MLGSSFCKGSSIRSYLLHVYLQFYEKKTATTYTYICLYIHYSHLSRSISQYLRNQEGNSEEEYTNI